MKSALVVLGAVAGSVFAQGVTEKISPDGVAPEGCEANYDGSFEISIAQVVGASKRGLPQKRGACSGDGILVSTLNDGVITDAKSRVGYIASNYQFQFDAPPQAGAIYTAGFSVCGNGSIALGSSTTFWMCQSGSFYNLYDRSWAAQCSPAELVVLPCGGDAAASQGGDGQVVGTKIVTTTVVKPLSDGQPQVITTEVPIPICQIGDGQVQGHTTPCASLTASAVATSNPAPVSQYSDGQIQVTGPGSVPATGSVTVPAFTPTGTATVVLPTETLPSSIQTVATVAPSSSAAAATTAVVTANVAGRVEMGSLAAFAVGLVGAVAAL